MCISKKNVQYCYGDEVVKFMLLLTNAVLLWIIRMNGDTKNN